MKSLLCPFGVNGPFQPTTFNSSATSDICDFQTTRQILKCKLSSLFRSFRHIVAVSIVFADRVSTTFRATCCSSHGSGNVEIRMQQQCFHTFAAQTARNSAMEVVLAKPPPCISSITHDRISRCRRTEWLLQPPVSLCYSRSQAPRAPSEPWITPQTKGLHSREILNVSLTPLFSLCRRRQPFLIHLRPNHYQQRRTPLTNVCLRAIYDRTLVGTLQ